mgnify:CR=1 FL=1
MNVIIPTYRRPGRVTTLDVLGPLAQVTLVVRDEEYQDYYRIYGLRPNTRVLKMPAEIDTLLKTRQWIWEHCVGHRKTVLCDDDIRGFYEREEDGSYARFSAEAGFNQVYAMLLHLEETLDDPLIAVAGPRSRRNPPLDCDIKSAADCTQFIAVDGAKLSGKGLRWDRCLCEDRDFYMQVLQKGLDVVHLQAWSYDSPPSGEGEGGLQATMDWGDRARMSRHGMAQLQALWPEYVEHSFKAPHGYTIRRARLLRDARRRLGMEKAECPGCGEDVLGSEDLTCTGCTQAIASAGGSADVLRALAKYLDRKSNVQRPAGEKRGRGRPPLGPDHPVLRKFLGKGPFRTEDVCASYKTKASAQVSLHNMVQRGLLRRLRPGTFEVVGQDGPTIVMPSPPIEGSFEQLMPRTAFTVQDMVWSQWPAEVPRPTPDEMHQARLRYEGHLNETGRTNSDFESGLEFVMTTYSRSLWWKFFFPVGHPKFYFSPPASGSVMADRAAGDESCYCMSQAMTGKSEACAYCKERRAEAVKVYGHPRTRPDEGFEEPKKGEE